MALGNIAARAAMATALFESKENLQVVLYLHYYYLNFLGCYTIVLELASSFENLNRHQIIITTTAVYSHDVIVREVFDQVICKVLYHGIAVG